MMAFDKSARSTDAAGHMRVVDCKVSREQVADYMGSELPDAASLGLNPATRYPLYRPASELQRAAPSFEGKPLLLDHRPQLAGDHDADAVCGTMSNVRFQAPYLIADLEIWTTEAIQLIESGAQKQLSCGYFFTADMTPGTFQGARYAGVQRNLRGNHCSLVALGRAGAECMVGDAAIPFYERDRGNPMSTQAVIREMQAIRTAEAEVAPMVGTVTGMGSAAAVYGEALRRLGMDEAEIVPLRGNGAQHVFYAARRGGRPRRVAMDARSTAAREKMFPNANRLA